MTVVVLLLSTLLRADEPRANSLPPTPPEMAPAEPDRVDDSAPAALPPREAPGEAVPVRPIPQVPAEENPFAQPTHSGPMDGFITDRTASRRIDLARQKLANEEYNDAFALLQSLLDREYDIVIASEADPERIESLKGLADRILAGLSPEARAAYELQFGIGARERLETASKTGDWKTIEEISQRFFRTEAGQEATYRLAMRAIDRNESLTGALLLDRLRNTGAEQYEPQLSMRMLLAAKRANLSELAEKARSRLNAMLNEAVADGVKNQMAGDGRQRFARWVKAREWERADGPSVWPTLTGDLDGVAESERVTVAGGAVWSYEFINSDSGRERSDSSVETLHRGVEQATKNARTMGEIRLPAFSPVIVGETAVFRTLLDIRAVDTTNGRLLWRTARAPSELFDKVMTNMAILLDEEFQNERSSNLAAQEYLSEYLWRNVTSGALSTDGRLIFAVENTGIARQTIVGMSRDGRPKALGQEPYNTLVAYDLQAQGRIAWRISGAPPNPLALTTTGTYFLGAPLPIGGMLFALAEQDGEIQLVAIDPESSDGARIQWRQPLVTADRGINSDPVRRLSGLRPSFSHGLLVCPTGTGAVVAVDLRDRTLQWGYRYRSDSLSTGPHRFVRGRIIMGGMRLSEIDRHERWVDSVPRISGSFVLATPRDSDELHCLDLETGELLWMQSREGSLYVGAIVDDMVIVVGSEAIEARDLATGDLQWRTPLGVETQPAGRGLLSGQIYYLPTTSGRICSIELVTGRILAPSDIGKEFAAGNLAAVDGRLISVSTRSIVGFHSLSKLDGARDASADAEMIALRGEDRIMRGELTAGIVDLRAAGLQGESERARDLLVETLLAGMRRDFAHYRQYASDVRKLIESSQERIEYSRIYAAGLAKGGEAVEAARVLLEVCQDSRQLGEFEQLSEDWRARLDRIIRAELATIYANSSAAERRRIDELIREQLARVLDRSDETQLAALATIAYETDAGIDALNALLLRYHAKGERLRARLLAVEMQIPRDEPLTKDPTIPADGSGNTNIPDDFSKNLQARHQPDELGSNEAETRVAATLPIQLVGSVPQRFLGWQFRVDARRRNLIALDSLGGERWRIPIREEQTTGGGLPIHVERFQARFQGPLLAVCVDTRLVVLDISSGTESPPVLWSKTMIVSNETNFPIREPVPVRGRARMPPRFGFAGPRVILYAGNRTITAADSLTGNELWSIASPDQQMDLLGDSEFVALAASASHAIVRRTSDGAPVTRNAEEVVAARLATQGTKIIRWETHGTGTALACHDMARDEDLWRFEFPLSARWRLLGTDRVAVLDPASGQLQIIRWTDGQIVLSTNIEANPGIKTFSMLEAGDRLILLTQTDKDRIPRLGGPVHQGQSWEPFRGLARGLDSSGRVEWSLPLEYCAICKDVPNSVPLLVALTEQRDLSTGRPQWTLTLTDARSGKTLIEQTREMPFVPLAIEGDAPRDEIEIRVPMARFVVEPALESSGASDPTS